MTPVPAPGAAVAAVSPPEAPPLLEPIPGGPVVPRAAAPAGPAVEGALEDARRTGAPARAAVVSVLRARLDAGRAELADRLASHPRRAAEVTAGYAALADMAVRGALHAAQIVHPNPLPTEGQRVATLAVGGYGRGEMAPFSDVDLLFLTPWKIDGWCESVIEETLYILWDLHLKVGHASRTLRDAIRMARADMTVRTTMLETRFLWGDGALADALADRIRSEVFGGTGPEFVAAKLAERAERLKKHGGQRYVTEPNVKEGKGGLRDLQSLFWIAKYVYGVGAEAELTGRVYTCAEFEDFERARDFLWAVRCHMHLATGRATEQLSFDLQAEVAERMGYRDAGGRRGVEHFMQGYFRHATRVGELTRILLTALEAEQIKAEPLLQRMFRRRPRVRAGFAVRQNRLDVADADSFLTDPVNLLRLFEEALRTGLLIHPDAMRLVSANLHLIDDGVRANREARRIFLDTILKHGNPDRALRRMNELGVLSAFIPEFEPIVAMMQFNMYHAFTVDEHTIQCIAQLAMIERGELSEPLPLATSILQAGVNRRALYVALLLHDIGKGREEDHSILGARIARTVAPRLGLPKAEAETVEWLVRNHLLMSDTAQKRDLSEPRTIQGFAKAVGTRARLDLLTVLTVCDIRGVGPGTWNNWKATLLRQLHARTAAALENGMEDVGRAQRETDARRALREALEGWSEGEIRAELTRHSGPYWQGLPTGVHVAVASLLRGIGTGDIRLDVAEDEGRDATRVAMAMADHPGLFARLAGALALAGANVVDASTFTTRDGWATSVFWVQDEEGRPYDAARLPRLRRAVERTLKGEIVTRDALAPRDKVKKRERAFRVPTHITFDNEGSGLYTIIEVDTRDRPGLLHDLARALAGSNVYIASAVIVTYGEQAVDTFYVKDMFGLKFHGRPRQQALERRLREAIEQGAERARG